MGSAPESPSSAGSPIAAELGTSKNVLRTMVALAALHAIAMGTLVLFALLAIRRVQYRDDAAVMAVIALGALVAVLIAHDRVLRSQRRQGDPRPWEFPTILTTAVLLASAQALVAISLNVENVVLLPVACLLLSLLGTTTLATLWHRHRFVFALASVVAVTLLLTGVWWLVAEREHQQEREELLLAREEIVRALTEFPLPIAVLDSSGWEPSGVWVEDDDASEAVIVYVPSEPTPELEGFSLTLRVRPIETKEETGWTPLYKGCAVEGGGEECEEHGDAVIATHRRGDEIRSVQARVEIADGVAATLTTDPTNDRRGEPTTAFPDIDMAQLSEHIRPAEAEDVEEVAAAVTDRAAN